MPYYVVINMPTALEQDILLLEGQTLHIGTEDNCDVLLNRQEMVHAINMMMTPIQNHWWLYVPTNWFIDSHDALKRQHARLVQDRVYTVKHRDSTLSFELSLRLMGLDTLIDPMHVISLHHLDRFVIGQRLDADIVVQTMQDAVILERQGSNWVLHPRRQAGVYVNGQCVAVPTVLPQRAYCWINQHSFYIESDQLYVSVSSTLRVQQETNQRTTVPCRSRYTHVRVYDMPMTQTLMIQAPEPLPPKPAHMVWRSVVTLLTLVGIVFGLQQFGIETQLLAYGLLAGGVSLCSAVLLAVSDRWYYKRLIAKRRMAYQAYIATQEAILKDCQAQEKMRRLQLYLSPQQLYELVLAKGERLGEKTALHPDFLQVRIGMGSLDSGIEIVFEQQGNDLIEMAKKALSAYAQLDDVPICVDFKTYRHVGIVGDADETFFKTLMTGLLCTHTAEEVRCLFLFQDEQTASRYEGLRWVPHVQCEGLGDSHGIAYTKAHAQELLDWVYRQQQDDSIDKHMVIFSYGLDWIFSHPLFQQTHHNVTLCYVAKRVEALPKHCQYILSCDASFVTYYDVAHYAKRKQARLDTMVTETFNDMLWHLGRLTSESVRESQGNIPQVSLFELLRVFHVSDLELEKRWRSSLRQRQLKVPIGLTSRLTPCYLDISDAKEGHGPHGLVAGTTGSGKSEFLQSYMLSAATLYAPEQLGFIVIDFKGGGLSNALIGLPHILGVMTNLDGDSLQRSMKLLEAEVIKRQKQFALYGVNHIDDYIAGTLADHNRLPLPHLVVIVDEFAQLKMAFPDVLTALISLARIGRTLGIHLLLATQKPAGVVDGQIWSNARFKVCFKVQTHEDSLDMLKNSLGATLTQAGRAYLQVGMDEMFEQFQSAYSTTPTPTGQRLTHVDLRIMSVALNGQKTCVYDPRGTQDGLPLQSEALVHAIRRHYQQQKRRVPQAVYPELQERYELQETWQDVLSAYHVPIGFYDDIANQQQPVWFLDLLQGHVFVTGGRQSGKTTVLQTVLTSLHQQYTAQQVNCYIVDCDQLALRVFEKGHLTGGYVHAGDSQLGHDLLLFLQKEMKKRQAIFAQLGISQFKQYIALQQKTLPLMVVCIDNIVAFQDYFEFGIESLATILRDGLSVGIVCLMTSPMVNGLAYPLRAHVHRFIGLSGLGQQDYIGLFDRHSIVPKQIEGRGLFVCDAQVYEGQIACFQSDKSPIERVEQLKTLVTEQHKTASRAMKIPTIPQAITYQQWGVNKEMAAGVMGKVPIGLRFDTVTCYEVSLAHQVLTLIGDQMQHQKIVTQLLAYIYAQQWETAYVLVVIDTSQQELGIFQKRVTYYETQVDRAMQLLQELVEQDVDKPLLVIVHHRAVVDRLLHDEVLGEKWLERLEETEDVLVLTQVANHIVTPFRSSALHQYMKDKQQVILCLPYAMNKWYDMPIKLDKHLVDDETIAYAVKSDRVIPIRVFEC